MLLCKSVCVCTVYVSTHVYFVKTVVRPPSLIKVIIMTKVKICIACSANAKSKYFHNFDLYVEWLSEQYDDRAWFGSLYRWVVSLEVVAVWLSPQVAVGWDLLVAQCR